MNNKIYPSMVIRSQAEAIELLKKENKELKGSLELYENGVIYDSRVDKLESVIDEIREYIEKHKMIGCDEFEYISTSPDTMLQILDKANEQKR